MVSPGWGQGPGGVSERGLGGPGGAGSLGNAMTPSSGPLKPETVVLLNFLFVNSTGHRVQGLS